MSYLQSLTALKDEVMHLSEMFDQHLPALPNVKKHYLEILIGLPFTNEEKVDILHGLLRKTLWIEHLWQPPNPRNELLFRAYLKIMTSREVRTLKVSGHSQTHTVMPGGHAIRCLIKIVQERDSLWHDETARYEAEESEAIQLAKASSDPEDTMTERSV